MSIYRNYLNTRGRFVVQRTNDATDPRTEVTYHYAWRVNPLDCSEILPTGQSPLKPGQAWHYNDDGALVPTGDPITDDPFWDYDPWGNLVAINQCPVEYPVNLGDNYVHTQEEASATWTITHNMGKYPAVAAFDGDGNELEGHITYVSDDVVTITFGEAFAGVAYLT